MKKDSFNDALKNHLNGNISIALKLYKKSLKDGLELPAIYNNIGRIYNSQEIFYHFLSKKTVIQI